jgi:DNA-binding transcriptional LysR family regulator
MDWGDLRYFVALARQGTLSGAAREVGAEHTTVARRVSALEASLGVHLFERDAKGFVLTPEGERMIETAYRIEAEIFGLQRTADSEAAGLTGVVRISAPPMFASAFLTPRLVALRRSHPGLVLELAGESRSVSLSRREADIAIRLARPEPSSVVARQTGRLAHGLYAAPDYLSRTPEAAWEFIGYDEHLDHTPQQRWLTSVARGRPLVFRTNALASLHSAAAAGMGLAVLPRFLGDPDPGLERLPVDAAAAARELWLVVHPDLRRSPRVRLVFYFVAELIRSERAMLDPADHD